MASVIKENVVGLYIPMNYVFGPQEVEGTCNLTTNESDSFFTKCVFSIQMVPVG